MTVEANYEFKLSVDETVDLDLEHTPDPELTHEIAADKGTLNANSDPKASKVWCQRVALTSGAASIDLTALDNGNLPDVDFTGLKIRLVKLSAPNTNSAGIAVGVGASNGYNLFGPTNATADRVIISPECVEMRNFHDTAEEVDSTHLAVDFAGAGTDVLDVELVAGSD